MKRLLKFNESQDESGSTEQDIREFFYEYTDEDSDCLTIKDCLIDLTDKTYIRVEKPTTYIKNAKNFKKGKIVEFTIGEADGAHLAGGEQCLTDIKILQNALALIDRFYKHLGEEVNYSVSSDYGTVKITFIIAGNEFDEKASSDVDKMDAHLDNLKEILKARGYKRVNDKGNWLEVRTPIGKGSRANFGDRSMDLRDYFRRIEAGTVNLQNTTSQGSIDLINWVADIRKDGFQLDTTGGDHQVVFRLKRSS